MIIQLKRYNEDYFFRILRIDLPINVNSHIVLLKVGLSENYDFDYAIYQEIDNQDLSYYKNQFEVYQSNALIDKNMIALCDKLGEDFLVLYGNDKYESEILTFAMNLEMSEIEKEMKRNFDKKMFLLGFEGFYTISNQLISEYNRQFNHFYLFPKNGLYCIGFSEISQLELPLIANNLSLEKAYEVLEKNLLDYF